MYFKLDISFTNISKFLGFMPLEMFIEIYMENTLILMLLEVLFHKFATIICVLDSWVFERNNNYRIHVTEH